MQTFDRIYGIDFSGAQDAGAHIWIAEAAWHGRRFTIQDIRPASALADGRTDRASVLSALRAFIGAASNALFGCDFPFSLPLAQLENPTWLAFASAFAARFDSADAFYAERGGRGREQRRTTDVISKAPFAPANLRLYRQTYYGIRDLLAPLVDARQAVIVPMQSAAAGLPTLIEVCPAVTLASMGLRVAGYKGHAATARARRALIIEGLRLRGIEFGDHAAETMLSNTSGDALDSAIAAYAAGIAQQLGALRREFTPLERLEGVIF